MQRRYEATAPLDAIQIDHAKIDVMVVDETGGDDFGRPWIALAFDVSTRMIAGFHISTSPPTRLSAGLCLLHAVCDKTRWLADRGISGEWPVSGLPRVVRTDSQSFFGPRVFARACREVGVENISSVPRRAGYGGHIEATIGRKLGAVKLLTEAVDMDRDAASDRAPRMTLREAERWVGAEIVGTYHQQRRPALKRSPLAAWRERESELSPRTPVDCVKFRLSFLPEEECALTDEGLNLNGRTFWSRALADDIIANRKNVAVRYDPRDLSRIFVKRPSGRFVKALSVDSLASARAAGQSGPPDKRPRLALNGENAPPIASMTPDVSIARGVKARDAAFAQEEMLEYDIAAAPYSARAANWRGSATCGTTRSTQNSACPRKCLSSCPFAIADR